MKIKRKQQMNLTQLIKWAWSNPEQVKSRVFKSNKSNIFGIYSKIRFSNDGHGFRTDGVVDDDTFIVEEEIEIKEDTVIPTLVTRTTMGSYGEWINHSVNDFYLKNVEAIYISNDDLTLTLIWTSEKGLVE